MERFDCDPERDRVELDQHLERPPPRPAAICARMVMLATSTVPGRVPAVARALADQGDGPAIDALLRLPAHVPGVVEGTFAAITRGVSRPRVDGSSAPAALALELRPSRGRSHAALRERLQAAFEASGRLEALCDRVGAPAEATVLRVVLHPNEHAIPWAEELGRIASRALPLAGTRLWVSGWCFDRHGPIRPAAAVLLVDAWCRHARALAVSPSVQGRQG